MGPVAPHSSVLWMGLAAAVLWACVPVPDNGLDAALGATDDAGQDDAGQDAGSDAGSPIPDGGGRPLPDAGPRPSPPTVATLAATALTSFSATLQGTINPNHSSATLYFEYGVAPATAPPESRQRQGLHPQVSADIGPLVQTSPTIIDSQPATRAEQSRPRAELDL